MAVAGDAESAKEPTININVGQAAVILFGLIFAGVFSVLLFSFDASNAETAFRRIGIGISIVGASLLCGCLVGFLFGIPRRLQNEAQNDADKNAQDPNSPGQSLYAANTNLEQISDWLTKIIVGIGLVHFTTITDKIGVYGKGVADAVSLPNGTAYGVSLILFFWISGFLCGYLWSRLYLGRALTLAEKTSQLQKQVGELQQQVEADAQALHECRQQLSGYGPVADSGRLKEAISHASTDAKALIFFQAQSQRAENWNRNKAKMERCIPVFEGLIASPGGDDYHRNFAQLAYAMKDKTEPDVARAEELLSTAIALRGDHQNEGWAAYEANRALCRIKLGKAFQATVASPEAAVAEIMADLKVGKSDRWVWQWLREDRSVVAWLAEHKVEPSSV